MKAAEKQAQVEKPKSAKADKEKAAPTPQAPSKPNTSKAPIKPAPAAPAPKNPPAKTPPPPAKSKPATTNNAKNPVVQAAPPVNPASVSTETKTAEASSNNDASTATKETPKYVKKKNFNFNKFVLFVQIQLVSARVYSRLKEFDKARSFYEKAIQKEPKVFFQRI